MHADVFATPTILAGVVITTHHAKHQRRRQAAFSAGQERGALLVSLALNRLERLLLAGRALLLLLLLRLVLRRLCEFLCRLAHAGTWLMIGSSPGPRSISTWI